MDREKESLEDTRRSNGVSKLKFKYNSFWFSEWNSPYAVYYNLYYRCLNVADGTRMYTVIAVVIVDCRPPISLSYCSFCICVFRISIFYSFIFNILCGRAACCSLSSDFGCFYFFDVVCIVTGASQTCFYRENETCHLRCLLANHQRRKNI